MAKLVLLVVAAAWAAVLIPPMLRSRVDNRPNSSVSEFSRQLNKLQSTATPARGAARAMGRPLAGSSPLQRQAAPGRPGMAAARSATARASGGGTATRQRGHRDPSGDMPRLRQHGDPTGGQRRPHEPADPYRGPSRAAHRDASGAHRRPGTDPRRGAPARQAAPRPVVDPATAVKRRRTNVLFILVVTAACTLFLAATTKSTAMMYSFGLSFLALCGYIYLLAQLRMRDEVSWNQGWLEHR